MDLVDPNSLDDALDIRTVLADVAVQLAAARQDAVAAGRPLTREERQLLGYVAALLVRRRTLAEE